MNEVLYWKGKDIELYTKDELIHIVKALVKREEREATERRRQNDTLSALEAGKPGC